MTIAMMLRSLVFASLLYPQAVMAQEEQCPLCLGGAEPDLSLTIGGAADGVSCSQLVSDVELDADGCQELQLLGYRHCGCPEYSQDYYCPMCKNSFMDIPNRFMMIPGTDITCDEHLFIKASDLNSCEDAMKAGYVCGCPEAEEPFCQICGGSMEDDENLGTPDALMTISGVGSYTCRELANQALLGSLSAEQCSLVQEQASSACGCVVSNPSTEDTKEEGVGNPEPSNSTVPVATDSATANGSGATFSQASNTPMIALTVALAVQMLTCL
jgi:hypothetical protein